MNDEYPDMAECPECGDDVVAMGWYSKWYQCDCGHFWIVDEDDLIAQK